MLIFSENTKSVTNGTSPINDDPLIPSSARLVIQLERQ